MHDMRIFLYDRPQFRDEELPKQATDKAHRLLSCLSGLFETSLTQNPVVYDPIHTDNEAKLFSMTRNLFLAALNFKADLSLRSQSVKLEWPKVGNWFEESSMAAQSENFSNLQYSRVNMTFLPSFTLSVPDDSLNGSWKALVLSKALVLVG